MRLLVAMSVVAVKTMHIRGNISRHVLPALFLVASMNIWSKGPYGALMTSSMLLTQKRRQDRKMKPVNMPMPMQYSMILGPWRCGSGISSIMCAVASKPVQMAIR